MLRYDPVGAYSNLPQDMNMITYFSAYNKPQPSSKCRLPVLLRTVYAQVCPFACMFRGACAPSRDRLVQDFVWPGKLYINILRSQGT